ncbi:MAG: ABC transporter permease subunit [Bacteroidota bacterium]
MLGLIYLTARELWARKITLGVFLVSTLAWVLLAFALNLDIVDGTLAGLRLFGQDLGAPDASDPTSGLLSLESFVINISSFVAGATYWLGTLLGLFATASLLSSLLAKGQVDLLLSKPLSRSRLLGAHLLGVHAMVSLLVLYLLGAVWLVLSIKTGVWAVQTLLAAALIVAMFSVMYSVVTLISVWTESTALALIVSYGLIFCSLFLAARDALELQIPLLWRYVYLGLYHVLPNFAEVTTLVAQLVNREPVPSWYPLLSSLGCASVLYGLAFLRFGRRDF